MIYIKRFDYANIPLFIGTYLGKVILIHLRCFLVSQSYSILWLQVNIISLILNLTFLAYIRHYFHSMNFPRSRLETKDD